MGSLYPRKLTFPQIIIDFYLPIFKWGDKRKLAPFFLWLGKVLLNERCGTCHAFSHWPKPCHVIIRKRNLIITILLRYCVTYFKKTIHCMLCSEYMYNDTYFCRLILKCILTEWHYMGIDRWTLKCSIHTHLQLSTQLGNSCLIIPLLWCWISVVTAQINENSTVCSTVCSV